MLAIDQAQGDTGAVGAKSRHEIVQRNVDEIARIEQERTANGPSERAAGLVTRLSGSMRYVGLHIVWFTAWILVNSGAFGNEPFDKSPFPLLTMTVSLEAIFLSVFVLMSENRQAIVADRRAKVDLQLNMLSEQEITKLLQMVSEIHRQMLPDGDHDPEAEHMKKETRVEAIADAVEAADN